MRKINFTVSLNDVAPRTSQFAGVQGENGATVLCFNADEDLLASIMAFESQYENVSYRFDCIDGSGKTLTGEALEYNGFPIEIPLTNLYTEMGGNICCSLVVSGFNNSDEASCVLISIPVTLYFKDFPAKESGYERNEFNKAVFQVKKMREETYDIAESALETENRIKQAADEFGAVCQNGIAQINQAGETANENALKSLEHAENSARYASAALTKSVETSGYASEAKESAVSASLSEAVCVAKTEQTSEFARQAEENALLAAGQVDKLIAFAGDVNAVLSALVYG